MGGGIVKQFSHGYAVVALMYQSAELWNNSFLTIQGHLLSIKVHLLTREPRRLTPAGWSPLLNMPYRGFGFSQKTLRLMRNSLERNDFQTLPNKDHSWKTTRQ